MANPDIGTADRKQVSPPIGTCLIDQTGLIKAADALLKATFPALSAGTGLVGRRITELTNDAELSKAIDLIWQGRADLEFRSHLGGGAPAPVRIRRMEGAAGPLALITFHVDAPKSAPNLDPLTGLPDRRAIADRVEAWRREAGGVTPSFAVLFLDLDDFKRVNDMHGHATGDRVLVELASRWQGCVREGDIVARYGGDEFVVLLKNIAVPAEAEPVVVRLCDATRAAVDLGELQLHVTATVGVAVAPQAAAAIDELIAAADRDMYARKHNDGV